MAKSDKDTKEKNERITPESVASEKKSDNKSTKKKSSKKTAPKKSATQQAAEAGVDMKDLIAQAKEELKAELRSEVKTQVEEEVERLTPQEYDAKKGGATQNDIQRHKSKRQKMKEFLANAPTIRTMIPLEGKEKVGEAYKTFIRNGYRLNIPKGVYVTLPEPVADKIESAQRMTDEALDPKSESGKSLRLDKADAKTIEAFEA